MGEDSRARPACHARREGHPVSCHLFRTAVLFLARLALAAVFVGFGVHKIQRPIDFLKVLREYSLLPESTPIFMNLTVVVLPWIEVLCGLLLLVGCWVRAAGALVAVMTAAFTAAVTIRALDVYSGGEIALCAIRFDCGCGQGEVLFCAKFLENLGLIALACAVIFVPSGGGLWRKLAGALRRRATSGEGLGPSGS